MDYPIDTLVYSYVCIYRLPTCLQGRSQDFPGVRTIFPIPPPVSLPLKSRIFLFFTCKVVNIQWVSRYNHRAINLLSLFLPSKVRSEWPNLKFLSALSICLFAWFVYRRVRHRVCILVADFSLHYHQLDFVIHRSGTNKGKQTSVLWKRLS